MLQLAEWDTDKFNMKVGNLIFEKLPSLDEFNNEIRNAREQKYDLLYYKGEYLPSNYICSNIILADEKILYHCFVSDINYNYDSKIVSYLHKELNVQTLTLALQSGGHSRYYLDKRFPVNVYLTLYKEWITNSLNGQLASDVLVYKNGDYEAGLLSYKLINNKVVIGLVDVDSTISGRGIGSKLIQSLLSKLDTGTEIEVSTQKCNIVACRFYEKNGFTVKNITPVYHIWL